MSNFPTAHHTYWDPRFKRNTVKILPGEYHTTKGAEMMVTVLGSCVSACIRDTNSGIGGMNHFLLPENKNKQNNTDWEKNYEHAETRYGDLAMEVLINNIIKQGGERKYFEAKLFGGAHMYQSRIRVGERNIDFVTEYLKQEKITISSVDLGGPQGRKIYYIPQTGQLYLKRIKNIHNNTLDKREQVYFKEAAKVRTEAEIDFF